MRRRATVEGQDDKPRLAKEQRCILQTQENIINNTRKAIYEIQVDMDLLAEEKKDLANTVANLNTLHESKYNLEKIKAISEV